MPPHMKPPIEGNNLHISQDMHTIPEKLITPLTQLLLSIADDRLILAHRNSDWTGLGPDLEEDIAFSDMSQEQIGHAQALYELVAVLTGGSADALAFGRRPEEYRCADVLAVPDEFDWAVSVARQFLFDHFDRLRLARLVQSSYKPLASLAERLRVEQTLHAEHVDTWLIQLGRGDHAANLRLQSALDHLAPHAPLLLEPTEAVEAVEAAGLYPKLEADMFDAWAGDVNKVAARADLSLQLQRPSAEALGGRRGRHNKEFLLVLDEMTEVYRIEPNAKW